MNPDEQTTDTEPTTPGETEQPPEVETDIQPDLLVTEAEPTAPEYFTEIITDQGIIKVIHEITLGDLLTVSFLFGIMILLLLSRVIKRG